MRTSAVALLALLAAGVAPAPGELRVKASPAVSPCVAAASAAFTSATGRRVVVETGNVEAVSSAAGADVVVGVEAELTRVIEGGASHPELDVDVARIPWVLLTPAESPADGLQALGRSTARLRVLGGTVAREARRTLGPLPAGEVETMRASAGIVRVGRGEAAVVPLSLAGPGHVAPLPVAPLLVRALGVRASPRPGAARVFLDFLTSEPGGAAFRACGRAETR